MFTGVGFGWSILALFCQALSLFTARRLGNTLWDYTGGHQVTVEPLKPMRLVTLVFVYAGALQLQMLVISPYVLKMAGDKYPVIKEEYQKNPPWHLPKRF